MLPQRKTIMPHIASLIDDSIAELLAECDASYLVGSRVTCNPPVTDTDIDILCHVSNLIKFIESAEQQGFTRGGYGQLPEDTPMLFISLKRDNHNLIVTTDIEFIEKFMLATRTAISLNLLKKVDRVNLFQAIIYGKG